MYHHKLKGVFMTKFTSLHSQWTLPVIAVLKLASNIKLEAVPQVNINTYRHGM